MNESMSNKAYSDLKRKNAELRRENEVLRQVLPLREQLESLIAESAGVAGLHLDGDLAKWDWLIDNEWLSAMQPDVQTVCRVKRRQGNE